jgi:hypothetical protein
MADGLDADFVDGDPAGIRRVLDIGDGCIGRPG